MQRMLPFAAAWCLVGCADRVGATADATVTPADAAVDGRTGEVGDAGPDAVRVRTCSELRLLEVVSTPGRANVAYPGARLELRGNDLVSIDRVSVGGVEMPFTREGDVVRTRVPAMLAVGAQSVVVANERCSASHPLTLSRLMARVPYAGGRVALHDWVGLDDAGSLDTGLATIAQAAFTMDGTGLLLRDRDGRVAVAWVADARVVALPWRAMGPFVLAQGTVVPTQSLLAVPTGAASGMLRVDTEAQAVTAYEGPASDPIGVATTLDGFRALVLDRGGVGYALDRPFARTPAWERFGAFTNVRAPAEIAMEQGDAVTIHGPLAAVYDASDPPAILPMDSLTGRLGERLEVPGAVGNLFFLSGDVVALDARTPEVITVDITPLTGTIDRHALEGEARDGVVRTHTAVTLYKLGAVVLRATTGGAPEGAMLHVIDYHREPAVEERQVRVAGLRGVVGVQGAGDPFVVWTAREMIRVRGDDGVIERRRTIPVGDGDVGFVVVHR